MVFLKVDARLTAFTEVFRQLRRLLTQQVVGLDDADTLGKVQHRLCQVLTLGLADVRILQPLPAHPLGDGQHQQHQRTPGKAQPRMDGKQERQHNGLSEDIAHHIRQRGHAVFLNKHHVGGEYRADFSDAPLGKVAHGQLPQVRPQLHPLFCEHHEPGRRLQAVRRVLAEHLHNQTDCHSRSHGQAQAAAGTAVQKRGQHQKRHADGCFRQKGLQERKHKGQLNTPLVTSRHIQDSLHQRDHANTSSTDTFQSAAPSAACQRV